MELILLNQWLIMSVFILTVFGIAVCFVGVISSAITALGNKKWFWGISILILGPITGIPYSIISKEAAYPKSLMVKGVLLLIPSLIYTIFYYYSELEFQKIINQ